jgi:hypothetical protein
LSILANGVSTVLAIDFAPPMVVLGAGRALSIARFEADIIHALDRLSRIRDQRVIAGTRKCLNFKEKRPLAGARVKRVACPFSP